jgi:hypothetical protein
MCRQCTAKWQDDSIQSGTVESNGGVPLNHIIFVFREGPKGPSLFYYKYLESFIEELFVAVFDKLPKNEQELIILSVELGFVNQVSSLLDVFRYVKSKYPAIESPFSFSNENNVTRPKVKVLRFIAADDTTINYLTTKAPYFKFSAGNGNRTKKGLASAGAKFEDSFENDLKLFVDAGDDANINQSSMKCIKELWSYYGLDKAKDIEIKNQSARKTKRPLSVSGSMLRLGNGGYDIGGDITDIDIIKDGSPIHLSLKVGGFSYFNLGVTSFFSEQEMKTGKITNTGGIAILNMFGIDNEKFCSVFNEYGKVGKPKETITSNKYDRSSLIHFMKQGVGMGYHFVRQTAREIEHFRMDQSMLDRKVAFNSVQVQYPYGTAKAVFVNIDNYVIHFRNNGGGVYPNVMLGYYNYKNG